PGQAHYANPRAPLFSHSRSAVLSSDLPSFSLADTATPVIYTLSLHDALPISSRAVGTSSTISIVMVALPEVVPSDTLTAKASVRSEEHTAELQSRRELVCRPPLAKK